MEQQFLKVIFHYYLHFHRLNKRQYKLCVSKPQANHKKKSKDKEFTNVSFCLSKNKHNIWKHFQDYITISEKENMVAWMAVCP